MLSAIAVQASAKSLKKWNSASMAMPRPLIASRSVRPFSVACSISRASEVSITVPVARAFSMRSSMPALPRSRNGIKSLPRPRPKICHAASSRFTSLGASLMRSASSFSSSSPLLRWPPMSVAEMPRRLNVSASGPVPVSDSDAARSRRSIAICARSAPTPAMSKAALSAESTGTDMPSVSEACSASSPSATISRVKATTRSMPSPATMAEPRLPKLAARSLTGPVTLSILARTASTPAVSSPICAPNLMLTRSSAIIRPRARAATPTLARG